jgi:hypothetical protein
VHVGAQLLELLLVLDPEVLLLVDDDETEVLEPDLLRQHRVGADDDLELAGLEALARLRGFLGGGETRQAPHLDRPAFEPLGEGLEVLAGQQGRRRHDRHLLPAHGHDEGCAQRHLGLAEANVAADQPVHRLAGPQVGQDVPDGVELIFRLLVGEAGAELVEHPVRRVYGLGLAGGAFGGDADQADGHLAQPILGPRLARLPSSAAQAVEDGAFGIRAVTGEQVDVLDRQVELGLAAVLQFERVVRRTLNVEGLQALVAADAVVDVDDQVALGQGRGLGQEVGRPPLSAWPRQAVAQDVGLGHDGQAVGLEPGLQRQDHALGNLRIGGSRGVPIGREADVLQTMVGQHRAQAIGRAVRPGGEQHPLALPRQRLGVLGGGLEQVDAVALAFGREAAALACAHVDDRLALGLLEGREAPRGAGGQLGLPFVLGQVELVGLQGVVVDLAVGLGAGVVGVGDHRHPLITRLAAQVIQADHRIGRQVVEQGRQARIKERQPVLHAGAARAFRHGGVERVIARRAEVLEVTGAETADGGLVQQGLAHRQQAHVLELAGRALGFGIEATDGFQGVAEQVQAHRLLGRRREDVDHPAADGELALLRNGGGARVSVDGEVALEVVDIHAVADAGGIAGLADHVARRHALQEGGNRGHQQHRRLGVDPGRELGQGRHPLGGDARRRTDAVVGQAVPGREGHDLDRRGEEAEGVGEGREPCPIAGDEDRQALTRLDDVGHHQGVEALGRTNQVEAAGIVGHPSHLRVAGRAGAVSRQCRRLARRELRSGIL